MYREGGVQPTYLVLSQGGGGDDRYHEQKHEVDVPSITLVWTSHESNFHSLPLLSSPLSCETADKSNITVHCELYSSISPMTNKIPQSLRDQV